MRNYKAGKHPWVGRRHSEESKAKMKASRARRRALGLRSYHGPVRSKAQQESSLRNLVLAHAARAHKPRKPIQPPMALCACGRKHIAKYDRCCYCRANLKPPSGPKPSLAESVAAAGDDSKKWDKILHDLKLGPYHAWPDWLSYGHDGLTEEDFSQLRLRKGKT